MHPAGAVTQSRSEQCDLQPTHPGAFGNEQVSGLELLSERALPKVVCRVHRAVSVSPLARLHHASRQYRGGSSVCFPGIVISVAMQGLGCE